MSNVLENKNISLRREGKYAILNYQGQENRLDYAPSVQVMRRQVFDTLKILKAPKSVQPEALKAINEFLKKEEFSQEENFSTSQLLNDSNPSGEGGTESGAGAPLVYEGKKAKYIIKANNGVCLSPASFFYKGKETVVVGELLLVHSLVEVEAEEGPQVKEGVEPFFAYAQHNGLEVERNYCPLRETDYLTVEDRSIMLDKHGLVKASIKTLLSTDGLQRFLAGEEPRGIKELFDDVKESIKQYVNFSWEERFYDLTSCYVLATYFFDMFSAFPQLYFYGSQGCGKSRAGLTVTYLSRHGYAVTDPSDAVIYRFGHSLKPTLFIDEGLLGPEAWKIARATFKAGVQVPRAEKTTKNQFVVNLYELFMPVVFASTNRPTEAGGIDADEARAIFVPMRQSKDPIGRDPEAEDFTQLREELYLFRLNRAPDVLKAFLEVKNHNLALYGHEREVWMPIFTIAHMVSEEVFESVKGLAKELYEVKFSDLYKEEKTVLRAIWKFCDTNKQSDLEGQEALEIDFSASSIQPYIKSVLEEDGEFDEVIFNREWNVRRVGRLLKRMGFHQLSSRSMGRKYVITKTALLEMTQRYQLDNGTFSGEAGHFLEGSNLKTSRILSSDSPSIDGVGTKRTFGTFSGGIDSEKNEGVSEAESTEKLRNREKNEGPENTQKISSVCLEKNVLNVPNVPAPSNLSSADGEKSGTFSEKPENENVPNDKKCPSINPTTKESCASCQEYQTDYGICSLDGESKDPGFSCSKFVPRPIERKCLTCKHWAGSEVTQIAFCTIKNQGMSKDFSCDSWGMR